VHKTILICLLKCLSICVFAQNEEENNRDIILLYVPVKETYLITGVGLNQFTQLETMVSPLVYKGIGAGASIGLQRRKKERITLLNTHWSKANLYNSFQPKQYSSALTHINLSASTCYLINKIQIKNITTRIGWQLSHQSDFRSNSQLQNSSLTYNFTTTLSPLLHFEKWLTITENKQRKFFKKQRSMRLSYQWAIPFVAAVARPPFNAIRILNDGSGKAYQNSVADEVISNIKYYSLNHFFAFNSHVTFEYFLKNSTRISLQYLWNFESFKVENKSYKVSQTVVQLSVHTRLNAL
jgi:hypothetical protein